MKYKIEDIVRDVRVALDENGVSNALVAIKDNDTLLLDELINSKLADAVRNITLASPIGLLDEGVDFSDREVVWPSGVAGIGWAYLMLPRDFMRLVAFKMSDWRMQVSDVIYPNSPKYQMQKSKYSGVRGNAEKPVCAIVAKPPYKVLECYSSNGGAKVSIEIARYLSLPEIRNDNTIEICEMLYRPVVYHAAGLALAALGDNKAEVLINQSMNFLK